MIFETIITYHNFVAENFEFTLETNLNLTKLKIEEVEIELNCPPAEHACRRGVRGALPEARRRLRWWQGHNLALKS